MKKNTLKFFTWLLTLISITFISCSGGNPVQSDEFENPIEINDEWSKTIIESDGFFAQTQGAVGWKTSIALGTENVVHIAYYAGDDGSDDGLRYATNKSGKWTIETITSHGGTGDVNSGTGWVPEIKLDESGSPHIAYYNQKSKLLKYACMKNGAWETATIDTILLNIEFSIAVTKEGVYILYYDFGTSSYATNISGEWITKKVDAGGYNVSLYLDKNGNLHSSWSDYENSHKYLLYSNTTSSSWISEIVDSIGNPGTFSKLAIDTEGYAYIVHQESNSDHLLFSTNISDKWVTSEIDTVGSTGWFPDFILDSHNIAHISYHDRSRRLKYARGEPGNWNIKIIDEEPKNTRSHSSIAIDCKGYIHISYYNDGNLKYATNAQ